MGFRTLKENEIEVRIGTCRDTGVSLLLYKDARVDMNILDESEKKWKREHQIVNGNLFCTVSIYDEEIKDWVSRQDVGVESNTEAAKGEASDSFKRACVNWGIGRELYSAPFIWVSADKVNITRSNGKTKCYDKFRVEKIAYDSNREITGLSIINDTNHERVFVLKPKETK